MMKPPPSAHSFFVQRTGPGSYVIGWTVELVRGGLALPSGFSEEVDRVHAQQFARAHGLTLPAEPPLLLEKRKARRRERKRGRR